MLKHILLLGNILLCIACNNSNNFNTSNILKRNYHLSNDSLEQSLELFSLGDSSIQFTLRVENKYHDTLDSYMSHATSMDNHTFIHERGNCLISFNIIGAQNDSVLLSQCNCPELTVQAQNGIMIADSSQISVFR
jgi:hypothetical protein